MEGVRERVQGREIQIIWTFSSAEASGFRGAAVFSPLIQRQWKQNVAQVVDAEELGLLFTLFFSSLS